jgi:hypothetical protein
MALYDDIYGIKNLKEREKLERERKEKNTQLLELISKELKKISEKVNLVEK